MLKSVLVAVDGTEPSRVAQELSIEICKRLGARLAGIEVLDRPWITAPQMTPIGASHFKAVRDAELLKRTQEKLAELMLNFEKQCESAGVNFSEAEFEGDPTQIIRVQSEVHDLIVIGNDTTFHLWPDEGTSDTVVRLARDDPRPILVTPSKKPGPGPIIAAFDGSLPASRSFHIFALLGLASGDDVHVVSVGGDRTEADRLAKQGAGIFKTHGISTTSEGIETKSHPAEPLIDRAKGGSMLIMGAFGHKELRDYFFGSCTSQILKACPIPLFIHH